MTMLRQELMKGKEHPRVSVQVLAGRRASRPFWIEHIHYFLGSRQHFLGIVVGRCLKVA